MNTKSFRGLIFFVLIFFGLAIHQTSATNYYSRANGLWSNTAIWSNTLGGSSCSCVPSLGNGNNVVINHNITLDKNLNSSGGGSPIKCTFTINAGATLDGGNTWSVDVQQNSGNLTVCGNLIAKNVVFGNSSVVNVCSSGHLVANTDFTNQNSSVNITINGTLYVAGTFINANGAAILGTTGRLNIIHPGSPSQNLGTIFGCTPGLVPPCPSSSSPCTIFAPGCFAILPVELLSFDLSYESKNVKINWVTASETNNDYFELQKSSDGREFYDIAKIKGAGNSTASTDYLLVDKNPVNGINYYRLYQVDYNGTKNYLPVKAIRVADGKEDIQIFPNPADGKEIYLFYSGEKEQKYTLVIQNINGKVIVNKNNLVLQRGYNHLPNETIGLSKGIYFLALILGNDEAYHQRLVVIN